MNIQHFWPTEGFLLNTAILRKMMLLRQETFNGFAMIEANRSGIVTPNEKLTTPRGQDVFRLLMFRCLEELCEAQASVDESHYSEEMIDAINYLWSAVTFDNSILSIPEAADALMERNTFSYTSYVGRELSHSYMWPFDDERLGIAVQLTANKLGDLLRNRSWMNNSQDAYFTGKPKLIELLCELTQLIYVSSFPDFSTFAKYFVAKDRVLQFRLRSKY